MLRPTGKVVLLLALLLSGCTLLPAGKPVQSWTLTPAPTLARSEVEMTGLRILRPQVQDLLSGHFMLVRPEGEAFHVYPGVRWSAAIPLLWRDYLVAALQRDSRFAAVSSDANRVAARYELVSRLEAFQTEYRQGRPQVVVRGHLQLVRSDSRELIAERPLSLSREVEGSDPAAVVAAFSALMAQGREQISSWLLAVNPDSA